MGSSKSVTEPPAIRFQVSACSAPMLTPKRREISRCRAL